MKGIPELLWVDQPFVSVVLVLASLFLFYMHTMYQRQLNDRQKEIDRLAQEVNRLTEDNREYRKMFRADILAAKKSP